MKNSYIELISETDIIRECSSKTWFYSRWKQTRLITWPIVILYLLLNIAQELPTTAVFLILNQELNVQPARINEIYGLWYLPGFFRPLFALLSDKLPIIGNRRKPYIVISSILCILASIFLSIDKLSSTQNSFVGLGMLLYFAATWTETIVDIMTVELVNSYVERAVAARLVVAAHLQTEAMIIKCLASLVASGASIGLVYVLSGYYRIIILCASMCYVLVICVTVFKPTTETEEKDLTFNPTPVKTTWRENLLQLWSASVFIIQPLIFTFIYSSIPDYSDTYDSFLAAEYRFQAWEYTLVTFIGLVGSFVGYIFYWKVLTKQSIRKMFIICSLLNALFGCIPLLVVTDVLESIISNSILIPIVSFITSFFSSIALMPSVILASIHAPKQMKLEGYMLNLFLLTMHLGSLLSAFLSSKLTSGFNISQSNWNGLWILIVVCCSLQLVPLLFIQLLKGGDRAATANLLNDTN